MCKIICSVTKSIQKEAELSQNENDHILLYIPTLLVELLVLIITQKVINKYAFSESCDHLDELLDENKEALRITQEFLRKWRMRRARGPSRKQIERTDAGDALSCSDSTILSVVSLTEQNNESMILDVMDDDGFDDPDLQKRYLWDVEEEDPNIQY
ncbi:hypothetical protein O0L34_g2931 [Tuta absoluta]|nr:hypothetical protein O0L34_g2931 [Tuta absoluta]